MHILVLPVSGGGFVTQLAGIQHLAISGYKPTVTLASSGGNVAAYVAAVADWKWAGIERVSRDLSKELFVKQWHSISSAAYIVGFFEGNSHRGGKGVDEFLRKFSDKKKIRKYEIWTGTYNKSQQKARLFCNIKEKYSVFDVSKIDLELTQSMPPVFVDGDISMIAKAGVASASIPSIVPPQIINEEEYIDGGIFGASPLTIMQEPILDYIEKNDESLHINYINSINLSEPYFLPKRNMVDCWYQTASDLIRSQNVVDRLSAYELLRLHKGKMIKDEFICNDINLKRVRKIRKIVKYSLLEIYPTEIISVNMMEFNGEDVVDGIRKSFEKLSCRFWWIEEDIEDIETVNDLLSECCTSSSK